MGLRGPLGKREEHKAGHRTKAEKALTEKVIVPAEDEVEVPTPTEAWHPIAKDWYDSLAASGQSKYMEPSDWQAARLIAEAMTRALAEEKLNARALAVVWSAMNDLLTTEGARRRVRLEIHRKTPGDAHPDVTNLDDYRGITG
ncbi:phage terminase small subunit [Lentzea chajnantorensis]